MTVRHFKYFKGVSLVEVMAAMVVLVVTVLGAGGYRYYCALDARKADVQITAARLASSLLESWRSANGSTAFDPTQLANPPDLVIDTIYKGPSWPTGFGLLGIYRINAGGLKYYTVLSWRDIPKDMDQLIPPGLRALNVFMAQPRQQGRILFKLTTYTTK